MPNEFKVKNGLIVDQGGASITGSSNISGSLGILSSGSSVFTVDGASGRLFSVDDSLSGSLFSVNTVAGLPVIEAFSDNTVRIGQYGQRALFVSQSRVGIGKESALNGTLDISGSITITGSISATLTQSSSLPAFVSYNTSSGQFFFTTGSASGTSGTSGTTGTSGTSGSSGTSGTSGATGSTGTSGTSGTTGTSGTSGTSGINGTSGTSGTSGISGTSGTSGISAGFTSFSKVAVILNNSLIAQSDTGSFIGWRAAFACTASAVCGFRDSGSGAVINAFKNTVATSLLATNLSINVTGSWVSSSTLQNANFNIGDSLYFNLVNFTGSLTEIGLQVDFIQ